MFLWFALAITSLLPAAQKLLDCFLPLYFYQSILVAACSRQTEFLLRVIFSRALLTVALGEGLASDFHICRMWRACLVCLRWILRRRGRKYGLCVNGEETTAGRGWRVKETHGGAAETKVVVWGDPFSVPPCSNQRETFRRALQSRAQPQHCSFTDRTPKTHTGRHGDNLNQSPSRRSERSLIPSCVSSSLKAFSSCPPPSLSSLSSPRLVLDRALLLCPCGMRDGLT